MDSLKIKIIFLFSNINNTISFINIRLDIAYLKIGRTVILDHLFFDNSILTLNCYMTSSVKSIYTFFYVLAALFLVAYIFITTKQLHDWGGGILMLFFTSLAIGFRGNKFLKGLSFTVIILAVVSLAMYYPEHFITIGSFKLSALIVPLLQIIMFGMGTELSLKDFARVLRMPKGVIVGIVCHYTIMPCNWVCSCQPF